MKFNKLRRDIKAESSSSIQSKIDMSFVVVYLIRAREYVVVPESWVFELNTAKLKNYGCNQNQDFLVFYSPENHGNVGAPNFNAPMANTLNAARNGGCFLGRIKKFFGKSLSFLFSNS